MSALAVIPEQALFRGYGSMILVGGRAWLEPCMKPEQALPTQDRFYLFLNMDFVSAVLIPS